MFEPATSADLAPLPLSWTGTLGVIRLPVPKFQSLNQEEIPLFLIG